LSRISRSATFRVQARFVEIVTTNLWVFDLRIVGSLKVGAVVVCELAHGLGLVSLGEEDDISRGDFVPGSAVPKAVNEIRLAECLHRRQVSIILEADEVIQTALFVGRALYRIVPRLSG